MPPTSSQILVPCVSFNSRLPTTNVMDATAIVMCRDHNLPLRVFNLNAAGDLLRVAQGEEPGTLVTNE